MLVTLNYVFIKAHRDYYCWLSSSGLQRSTLKFKMFTASNYNCKFILNVSVTFTRKQDLRFHVIRLHAISGAVISTSTRNRSAITNVY